MLYSVLIEWEGKKVLVFELSRMIYTINNNTQSNIKQIWVTVKTSELYIAMGAVYKLLSLSYKRFCNKLQETCAEIIPLHHRIYFLGNINMDVTCPNTPAAFYLLHFMSSLDLVQIIAEPTRLDSSMQSLLDVIVSDVDNIIDLIICRS